MNKKTPVVIGLSIVVFGLTIGVLGTEVPWEARASIGITVAAIVLWATEAIPFGQTSLLVLICLVVTGAASVEEAFSGFAKGAIYLIVGGMMMAQAVNQTTLGKRITYAVMARTQGDMKRILWAVILIPQILAFFIPATGVRTTLLLPLVISIADLLQLSKRSGERKQVLVGLAFGANVSGTAILPAAIGNVLTIEVLDIYLDQNISYFAWLWYTFPIWLGMIPVTWWCIRRAFPARQESYIELVQVMRQKLRELGPLRREEKQCLLILLCTVALWMSEGWHGLHPSIPALFAVVLMSFPKIGVVTWKKVVRVDYDMVLLLGATLSLGIVLNRSGAITVVTNWLEGPWLMHLAEIPMLLILAVIVMTHIYHLGVSNVSTAVVTLLPIVIGVAFETGKDPVVLCVLAAVTTLYGFLLVVETIPNVVVYATGELKQQDFWRAGIPLTIWSVIILLAVALTWWKWINFV